MKPLLFLAGVSAVLSVSCVEVRQSTRVERGSFLRMFDRDLVLPGGVNGSLQVAWPNVTLKVLQYETCRVESVTENVEEKITEHVAPAAGPAFSTGITNLGASLVLLIVSAAVSGAPNTSVLYTDGHYGASTRQYLQGAALVTGIVGVPALIVGLVSAVRAREERHSGVVQTVTSQKDSACHEAQASGSVTIELAANAKLDRALDANGAVSWTTADVTQPMSGFRVGTQQVELDADSRVLFAALNACVEVPSTQPDWSKLDQQAALAQRVVMLKCRPARPELESWLLALERDLTHR